MGRQYWTCWHIAGSGTVAVALIPSQIGTFTSCVENLWIFEASTKAKIILQSSVSENQWILVPAVQVGRLLYRCGGGNYIWCTKSTIQGRVKVMTTHWFFDTNNALDNITRRSHTGILTFCNRAPITWFSKCQKAVETLTFGSEFTALKQTAEMVKSQRYKLRMFRLPI